MNRRRKMNVDEVMKIKETIKRAQEEALKAQGAIDTIEKDWKETYGTSNIDEINALLLDYTNKLQSLEKKKEIVENDLLNACDWEEVKRKLSR